MNMRRLAADDGSDPRSGRLVAEDEEDSYDDPDLVAHDLGIDAAERPPRRQPSTSSTRSRARSPEPRSARVAEAREHRPDPAVLRPGQLGEGEPEVAVEVGPEPQCPEAGAG